MRFLRRRVVCGWFSLLVIPLKVVCAEESLVPPTPLAPVASAAAPSEALVKLAAAESALDLGFSTAAVEIYQTLLTEPVGEGTRHNDIVLGLTTALLNLSRVTDAEQALKKFSGAPTSAAQVRAGLIAAHQKRWDDARGASGAANLDELTPPDRGWLYFLKGWITESTAAATRDNNQKNQLYKQAAESYQQSVEIAAANPVAVSEAQKARFLLAREHVRFVRDGPPSDDAIKGFRQAIERSPGRPDGYAAVSLLAVGLQARGLIPEAVALLRAQLNVLPREQREVSDEWLLLLSIIAGPEDSAGRNAMRTLLTGGSDRDKQRMALQLLAGSSSNSARREEFRKKLDELIGATPPHPILEDLLLFRAQVALYEKDYGTAEAETLRLLNDYPGTQLKAAAYGLLAGKAWENGQYLAAANQATKARAALPPGDLHAQLGVLIAEAYFRHKDYRNAADAYAATLADVPKGVSAGDLLFQRAYAEILASPLDGSPGALEQAQSLLDELSKDPRLDKINRWRAEWNLARALQIAGQSSLAFARVNRLLLNASNTAGLPPDLKARMSWLQAQLSLDAGDPAKTLALAEKLLNSLEALAAPMKEEIASTTRLLEIKATLAVGKPESESAAAGLWNKLRADYPSTEAAIDSYQVEAELAAKKNDLATAKRLLMKIGEDFPKSPYAPSALYLAAKYAEGRADRASYLEANQLLEKLVNRYPDSDYVFYARLKQGQLLRLLDHYPQAQAAYDEIINKFPQHRDVYAAQLALADCYAAQASSDLSRQSSAEAKYARLTELPGAPLDLRVEAGFKYGQSLANRGESLEALKAWWTAVNNFLLNEAKAESLGANGRYWIGRTLYYYGQLMETQGKLEEAGRAYDLMIGKHLPDAASARDRLVRIRPVPSSVVAKP